jgi:hypothetical protein
MITLMEITVYAVILSGGHTAIDCHGSDHERVTCSNGLEAMVTEAGDIAFSNDVIVHRNNGFPTFSDGTRSWLDSMGSVTFSTGIHVRRMSSDYFKFSTGIECKTQLPTVVQCVSIPQRPEPWP